MVVEAVDQTQTMLITAISISLAVGFAIHSPMTDGQYRRNIAFDGPFNDRAKPVHRRLLGNESYPTDGVLFHHGVASGEPTDSDLLIWTRVTPPFQNEYGSDRNDTFTQSYLNALKSAYHTLSIQWAISKSNDTMDFDCDDSFCGTTLTSVDVDYTVKLIVDGLEADSWYFYQFKIGDTTSDIGHTRTIPSNDSSVSSWRFAFSSCKMYAHGFFNNLGDIADRDDLDMMLWLGDYIYEFPNDPYVNGSAIGRVPIPNNFLYSLDHYRRRYLQHHLDKDLQAAHRELPWYLIWDDHEVVNDYWMDGAPSRWQDDSLYGVEFDDRRMNGYQAFFEWTPTRTLDVDSRGGLYRSYRFGDLFDLILTDARSQRTEAAENLTVAETLSVDDHYVLGETQREWLLNKLSESQSTGVRWRMVGNNAVFAQSPSGIFDEVLFGEDKWEGYPAERQLIIDSIIDGGIDNVVALTGGPHIGIAQKVYSSGEPIWNDSSSYPVFTEFTVDALSAPKFDDDDLAVYLDNYKEDWSWVSPYFRLKVDGYSIMEVNKERVAVEFWINNNTKSQHTVSTLDELLCVYDGVVEFSECVMTSSTIVPDEEFEKEIGIGLIFTISAGVVWAAVILLVVYVRNIKGKDESLPSPRAFHVADASPMSTDGLGRATHDNDL